MPEFFLSVYEFQNFQIQLSEYSTLCNVFREIAVEISNSVGLVDKLEIIYVNIIVIIYDVHFQTLLYIFQGLLNCGAFVNIWYVTNYYNNIK